jgi:hypothetical protein
MKVIAKNDWIYLRADFDNLNGGERTYMEDCYWKGAPWCDKDEEGDCPLYKHENAKDNLFAIEKVLHMAYLRHFVDLKDSEINAVLDKAKEEAEKQREIERKEYAAKEYLKELKMRVERAYTKLRDGCAGCDELRYTKDGHRCLYADRMCRKNKEEEEYEFYAKREAKLCNIDCTYFARPYPCAGCKHIELAKKAQEELETLTNK